MPNVRSDANHEALRALGRAVREARQTAGMTQKVLAEEVGVSRGTIANVERGSQNTTAAVLFTIAMACETTLDEIVSRSTHHWR